MEPRELSHSQLLELQVTVVATLGELVATTARLDGDVMLAVSPGFLHLALESFTHQLSFTLDHAGLTWWHREDEPPISLGRVLAACESTPGVTWDHVTMMASEWLRSVAVLEQSWFQLARKATKLHDACRDAATGRSTAMAVRRAMGEAMGEHTGEAVVAPSPMATTMRQQEEVALGLLERLVAACDEATAFPRELQCLVEDIEATLKGTNQVSHDVPEDLVAKVAVAERLWEASARLAKDHLLGTLGDIDSLFFSCDPDGPSGHAVAERCQKAIEDIPRLLQDSDVTPVTSLWQ